MYLFNGWTIEIRVSEKLSVVVDKEDKHLIMFDEDKDLLAWIYLSNLGEGIAFEKMSWAAQFHVFHNEKKIIITSSKQEEN